LINLGVDEALEVDCQINAVEHVVPKATGFDLMKQPKKEPKKQPKQ